MKDDRAFILREDKAEEFLSKAKNKRGGRMRLIDADRLLDKRKLHLFYHLKNGDVAIPIIDVEHAPTVDAIPRENIKLLGEELRKVREGITDEKVLIGFNMAIAICNKYLGESEDKE